ncbi:hypothetical protein Taro_026768, partial [Colocasia esculenta]|nr:hypothetical protein [Colocasia esculenta]
LPSQLSSGATIPEVEQAPEMSGLLAYSVAGLGLLLIGVAESLAPFLPLPHHIPFRFLSAASLAALALLNSLLSSLDAVRPPPRRDPLGLALQLDSAAVASIFLLYALAGAGASSRRFRLHLPLPPSLLDLLCLFAFAAEFLLFALQRKDVTGVENRYYDLLLVPVAVCAAGTALCATRPGAPFPRLARGIGLSLQGTWFLQMGFSFFSSAISHGCDLHQRSRGNFTIKCKGHPQYHRGRAIATLQFDGHLALLVVATLGIYAAMVSRRDHLLPGDRYRKYKPLSEMQRFDHLPPSHFTLDSSDDEAVAGERGRENGEITAESQELRLMPVSALNGSTR